MIMYQTIASCVLVVAVVTMTCAGQSPYAPDVKDFTMRTENAEGALVGFYSCSTELQACYSNSSFLDLYGGQAFTNCSANPPTKYELSHTGACTPATPSSAECPFQRTGFPFTYIEDADFVKTTTYKGVPALQFHAETEIDGEFYDFFVGVTSHEPIGIQLSQPNAGHVEEYPVVDWSINPLPYSHFYPPAACKPSK